MAAAKLEAVPDTARSVSTLGADDLTFDYRGSRYPGFLKDGNGQHWIATLAKYFCRGVGLDVGSGPWPLPGAHPIDLKRGSDAMALPEGIWDYVFSSHCLEHLDDYVAALEHWKTRIRPGGVLYLYLPHPDMRYWRPENCRKHRHMFHPADMAQCLRELGFVNVLYSERDFGWSFSVVGFNG